MKKLLSCMAVIMAMVLLAGCEWGSSGGDSSWSDSYSWANFAGVYRPPLGNSYLVTSFSGGSSSGTTTTSNGVDVGYVVDEIIEEDVAGERLISGVLDYAPVAGTLTIESGGESFTDPDGTGILVGSDGGSGTINNDTGAYECTFTQFVYGDVLASYTYVIGGGGGSGPGGDDDDSARMIYSLILSQDGQHLSAIDNRGVGYSGTISRMAQSGGDSSGNTSGSIVGNFTMTSDDGAKIVGILQGTYLSPRDNGGDDGGEDDTSINAAITVSGKVADDAATVTTGQLINRAMQGTYIGTSGSTGDLQGQAGGITVTISN